MIRLIGKLAPLITGMTKAEDGSPEKVPGEFNWLVRLPMALGAILLLAGLFAPVDADKKEEVYEVGMALLVGGPVAYGTRKQLKKGQAVAQPAPMAPPEPPVMVPPPQSDADAAKQIENL
jgi:uncharacterized membrane protein YebE (DUF533 family)